MKIFVYSMILFFGGLLFLPRNAYSPMRNVPLLLFILSAISIFYLYRFIKYIILMHRAKKFFLQRGMKLIKWRILPMIPVLRSHYSMSFENKDFTVNVIFLVRRKKYIQYHFKNTQQIEFYKTIREGFPGLKINGPNFSKKLDRRLVGRQRLLWNKNLETAKQKRIILFDVLPLQISDSTKTNDFFNGDCICSSNIYLCDLKYLQNSHFPEFYNE